jgi:alpha-L-rhamnosidase
MEMSSTAAARHGLGSESDSRRWTAKWISPAESERAATAEDRGAYLLRKSFDLSKRPSSAKISASALGVYEVYINGTRAGDVELAPGSTSYDTTLYFQTYEVTDLLKAGGNRIDIVLSDGWYRGRNGGTQHRDVWGQTTAAILELEMHYSDGTFHCVVSDADWTTLPSRIVRADLMRGQTTDFRINPDEFEGAPVRVDVVTSPSPTRSPAPPVRRIREQVPASLRLLRAGVSILDTGQNLSGWLRLDNIGAPGSTTVMEFGEHLDATGDLSTSHLDMATPDGQSINFQQMDQVIAGEKHESFEPRHTVHGFRYVRITHPGRELRLTDLTVIVVHSDLERRGWFRCSDETLERLHNAALWSFRGNIVDVPTDCPTRERSGWTGDYQVFAPVAAMLYDVSGFTAKWLQSVRDDQCADGLPAAFSPDSLRTKYHPDCPTRLIGASAGWGDATVVVPWTMYATYGDRTRLEESWHSMRAWVDYALGLARTLRHPARVVRSSTPLPHERYIWDGPFHYGEWLEPKERREDGTLIDPMKEDPRGYMSADRGEVGTAYLYRSTRLLSRAAAALGRLQESIHYDELSEKIKAAWRKEFLKPDGRTVGDTQGSYVTALAFGLVPVHLRQRASDRLAALIRQAGVRLGTGFLSSGMLLPVLAENGYAELAYDLLLRRGTPSWLGMLDRGATTVWEDWEGVDEHGEAHESLNHYSKGAVISFLHSFLVGLRQAPESVAWRNFHVRPFPGGGVTSASFRYKAPRGEINVEWEIKGNSFELCVLVPTDSQATLTLPDGSTTHHGPGQHNRSCLI